MPKVKSRRTRMMSSDTFVMFCCFVEYLAKISSVLKELRTFNRLSDMIVKYLEHLAVLELKYLKIQSFVTYFVFMAAVLSPKRLRF